MSDMTCSGCAFFQRLHSKSGSGTCHRHAPSPFQNIQNMILHLLADLHYKAFEGLTDISKGMDIEGNDPELANWPIVDDADWCGEFKGSPTPANLES